MTRLDPRHKFCLLSILFICSISLVSAQTGTSFNLRGTVKDAQGGVVPGVTVTIRNDSIGLERTAVTNDSGEYLAIALPPTGEYSISVEMSGFRTETRRGLRFEANTEPVLDFTLEVGAADQVVVVTSTAPLVQKTKAELSDSVGAESIEDLPLGQGRNFFDYVTLAAGAVRTGGGSGDVNFNGVGRRNVTILTDGMTDQNREIRTQDLGAPLQVESIKEVQVITNNFAAEFGRSPSAVVNAVTRSGTNQFHGNLFWFQRFGKADANNALTGTNNETNRYQFGGSIGGPIVRDRTHFFFTGEKLDEKSKAGAVVSVLEPGGRRDIISETDSKRFLIKINHQINENHQLDGRFNYSKQDQPNIGIGGLNTSERAGNVSNDANNTVIGWTSILRPQVVNEFRFGYNNIVFDLFPSCVPSSLPPDFSNCGPAINRPGVGNTGPNPSWPQNLDEESFQIVNKTSWNTGDHNIKFGIDFQKYNRFVTFFSNFNGVYDFAPGAPFPYDPNNTASFPIRFQQTFGTSGLRFNEWVMGLFVQDDLRLSSNFTLNLGLRYDYEDLLKDGNNLAPRVGFAWDLLGSGKTILRAAYGHFYATMETSMINRESNFGPATLSIQLQQGDPLFPQFPNVFSQFPTGANVVRNLAYIPITRGLSEQDFPFSVGEQYPHLRRNPKAQHATLGIQQQLTGNLVVSADYTFVRALDLFRTVDLNAPPFFAVGPGLTRSLSQADALRPFGVPSVVPGPLGIQFGGFRRLLLQESGNQSFYHALKLNLTKRFSNRFSAEFNYVLSKSISDSDNFREGNAQPPDPANIVASMRALSDTDRRHNFVGHGIFELPWGLRLTGIASLQSGFRYTGRTGSDSNGDGLNSSVADRPGALGRNTFGSSAYYNFDANLAKTFALTDTQHLELRWDVFNLFNHPNVSSVFTTIGLDAGNPNANFGNPTGTFASRNLQFALRYVF